MSTIAEIENEITEDFALFDDWMEKYNYLIEQGDTLAPLSEAQHDDNFLIKGCQSKVWLHSTHNDNKVFYHADSDAAITKGIIALLVRVLSGHTPDEIINAELSFVDRIGMKEHLSPNRTNGLFAMIKQMKMDALAHKSQTA